MPLTFNLRHLDRKNLHLTGDLPCAELDAEGLDELITLREPIHYDLQVERLGSDLLVQGSLQVTLDCECARCLKRFQTTIPLEPWSLDLPLTGEDKVPVDNDSVDLTPFIREDILLAFPQHPLCERECGGLPKAPRELAQSAGGANRRDIGESASPWAELNKLKF